MALRGAVVVTALGLTTIGCGAAPAQDADVATLQQPSGNDEAAPGTTVPEASKDPQEAFRAFAQCMRDHGVDMPDPKVSEASDAGGGGGGMVVMGQAGAPADRDKMDAAQKECEPLIKDAIANAPRPDPEEEARMKEQALGFSKCMREHGVDMPDPTFEEGGGVTMQLDGGADPSSSVFQDAQKACQEFMKGPNGETPPMIGPGGPEGGDGFVTSGDAVVGAKPEVAR